MQGSQTGRILILKFIWGQNIGKRRQPREFFFCGCETSSRRISYLKFASWSKVICCSLVSKLCPTLWDPWTTACQAPLSFTVVWNYSDSCPLSQCCYLTISSSTIPFSFCVQSFPALGSFPMVSWHQVAKILELGPQQLSFQWIFRVGFL